MGAASDTTTYAHLGPRQGSSYRQFFLKGRKIRAETLYRATVGPEPMTAEEVAADYDVPVDAVREAIHYCETHAALLDEERARDRAAGESLMTPEARAYLQADSPSR